MKSRLVALRTRIFDRQKGGIGYVLLWLLGVPMVLLLLFLIRGWT